MIRKSWATAVLFAFVIVNQTSAIGQKAIAWSYTSEELKKAARAYVEMRNSPNPDDFESFLKAGEFKGYISGLIDMHANRDEAIEACARKFSVNDLAGRSALLISTAPLNRSSLAVTSALIALRMSCDDRNFLDEASKTEKSTTKPNATKETPKSSKFQQPESHVDREQQETTGYIASEPQQAEGGLSSFTVDNSSGAGDAVVRIYAGGKKPAVRSFFVKSGETFKSEKLKVGMYVMRYRYMGSADTYEANKMFHLSESDEGGRIKYSNVRVTLFKVRDGNLSTKKVDPSLF